MLPTLSRTSNGLEAIFGELEVGLVRLVVRLDLDRLLETVDGLLVLLHARVGQAHAAVSFAVAKNVKVKFWTSKLRTFKFVTATP